MPGSPFLSNIPEKTYLEPRLSIQFMKKISLFLSLVIICIIPAFAQQYSPAMENFQARRQYQDSKFGMFIHWGLSSSLADGEWVMNNRNIKVEDYTKLMSSFNPVDFDAEKWVSTAKNAGMKYIVFITRHHDGFSNWDTKYSDFKITNTLYGKDVLKQISAECKKQGIKLGLYYSLLDWTRSDYPYETGRTGQGTGRTQKSDYASYLQFMKNQLTELLTNYGEIMSIWFDGHWDQTNPEGNADRSSRIDWKYNEIYTLIHSLQPQCLIGNNHHLDPIPGEDFQMFERDLPGENKSGLSYQQASALPLETCETMNGSWGYNKNDSSYKSVNQVIQLLVGSAGRNANFLLNIGPMPSGVIQKEFRDTLTSVGKWMQQNGQSIYGTRGGPTKPQPWGVTTQSLNNIYIHIMYPYESETIYIPLKTKPKQVKLLGMDTDVKYIMQKDGISISSKGLALKYPDTIIWVQQ
jgi:alpha-L-fucosidase